MTRTSITYFPETGTDYIDGLISGAYWQLDPARTLTWGLGDFGYTWSNTGYQVIQAAFDAWEAVIDIDFRYMGDYRDYKNPAVDIMVSLHDDSYFGNSNIAGIGLFPNMAFADSFLVSNGNSRISYQNPEGDITFNIDSPVFDWINIGSNLFHIVLHEIGHALGLKHPHDGGLAGYTTYQAAGLDAYDSGFLTLMSYEPTSHIWQYGWGSTPLPLDIIAAQTMYGANQTTGMGDTTHTLSEDGLLRTIYDVSGNDTLDARNIDHGLTLKLQQGSFTTVNTLSTVYIAVNTVIENVVGSYFNDLIVGENGENILLGLSGNDEIQGLGGNDLISGGSGNDLILGQGGRDELQGGNGADELQGGSGDDKLFGQAGIDKLFGESGNDIFVGGEGNDTIYGGIGHDTAEYAGNRANYTILFEEGLSRGIVEDNVSTDGLDNLTDISRLSFSDINIALDITLNPGVAYRLYKAAFDRAPDLAGLGFWIEALDNGETALKMASEFNSSPEFISLYGANNSNDDYLSLLYNNVLDRDGDTTGHAFWLGHLDAGSVTRERLLIDFSESIENKANVAELIANGIDYTAYVVG